VETLSYVDTFGKAADQNGNFDERSIDMCIY